MAATNENLYLFNGKVEMSDGFRFWAEGIEAERLNGKVIGEFVCNKMLESFLNNNDGWFVEKGCLTQKEIDEYQGDKAVLYGWHISDLVIYDTPKELSEFRHCGVNYHFNPTVLRPPQSWCYVEELK